MKTRSPTIKLANSLSSQPWNNIGELPPPLHATPKIDEITEQLSAILALRLDVLLLSRKFKHTSPHGIIKELSSKTTTFDSIVGTKVHDELIEYVSVILSMYNDTSYHSREHCAHVTISLNRLISYTIDAADEDKPDVTRKKCGRSHSVDIYKWQKIPDLTNKMTPWNGNIAKRPLLQFALPFAALIHDVGHTGVPNRQLVVEMDDLALLYNDRSVAENNSLNVGFTVLREDRFASLRGALCPTPGDSRKFRSAVIDLVLTTDIASPERAQINKSKWKEAFEAIPRLGFDSNVCKDSKGDIENMKDVGSNRSLLNARHSTPTIKDYLSNNSRLGIKRALLLNGKTIELYANTVEGADELKAHAIVGRMIEMADVAHNFQSWETYLKWNRRLFKEQLVAFRAGRGVDPTLNWYANQITFFDCYIIPLSKKMIQSGAFGRYGYIFFNQAQKNRNRWMKEGEIVCKSFYKLKLSDEEVGTQYINGDQSCDLITKETAKIPC